MKTIKIIGNWLLFILIIAGIFMGCRLTLRFDLDQCRFHLPSMDGPQVVFIAFCLAFFWVEVLRWGNRKPFTCTKCMTGWFALILALVFRVDHWYFYPFIGVTIGSLFEAIKMRWL